MIHVVCSSGPVGRILHARRNSNVRRSATTHSHIILEPVEGGEVLVSVVARDSRLTPRSVLLTVLLALSSDSV